MAAISQLGYLGIGVSDAAKWEAFAGGILGLELSSRGEDGSLYLRMDEYHHRIAVHPGGSDDIAYAGWMVPTPEALHAFRERLVSHGVAVRPGTAAEIEQRKVLDLISFEDPNGIRLELFYGLQVRAAPFRPTRAISGFRAGELGLGHIVLTAKDIGKTLAFYRDVLGLRISDYIDFDIGQHPVRMAFMHANPRHHSAAFAQLPRKKTLAHFMIELNSLDDVCATLYLCQEKGVGIAATLGRHSNDHMFSFYMHSPSGFEIEYGFGGRLVDDATWVIQHHKTTSIWGHKRAAHGAPAAP
jgi:2,3-dihydroxybiphenyl 1,2-dioxygenase